MDTQATPCGCSGAAQGKDQNTLKLVNDTFVPAGAVLDLEGDFDAGRLYNNGTINVAPGKTLTAMELYNNGRIATESGDLRVLTGLVVCGEKASFLASSELHIESREDLLVEGGKFESPQVIFRSGGYIAVNAGRIVGTAHAHAEGIVSIGAHEGDLALGEICGHGDPVVYSNGSLSCSGFSTGGQDLVLLASGNITVNGNIDTGSAKLTIGAGVSYSVSGSSSSGPCGSGSSQINCSSCDSNFSILSSGSGTLSITGSITAGSVSIKSGSVSIGDDITTAGGAVVIDATSNSSYSITISGSIASSGGAIILAAGGPIRVDGDLNNGSVNNGTDIRIFANYDGTSSSEFVIGGSGNANGINGNILNTTQSGGGFQDSTRATYISNGAGGISIVDGSAINVTGSASRSASIILDAHDGNVTLQAGLLSADGSNPFPAGLVLILANELITQNGAAISASDIGSQVDHYVSICASEISYSGGLTIYANGSGRQGVPGTIALSAKGSNTWASAPTLDPTVVIAIGALNFQRTQLTIGGSGDLTLNAYGNYMQIYADAYPVVFDGDDVTVLAIGSNTGVTFTYPGSPAGNVSLNFAGGAVTCYADNPSGNAGNVTIHADQIATPASTVSLNANATSSGNGGTVQVGFDSGNLHLGEFSCSAAGTGASGNGGRIAIAGVQSSTSIVLDPSFSGSTLNASALGTNGNGGRIEMQAGSLNTTSAGTPSLYATGNGTGHGGIVDINVGNDITVGSSPGLMLVASANGTGSGGTVRLVTGSSITLDSGYLHIEAGSASGSNGNGGSLVATAGTDITLTNWVYATGAGSGQGGFISLDAGGTLDIGENLLIANGGSTGGGGTVNLKSHDDLSIGGDSQFYVSAGTGTGSNGFGGSVMVETTTNLTLTGNISANGQGSGPGGVIRLYAHGALDIGENQFFAQGGTTGNGGFIILISGSDLSAAGDGQMSATPGAGTGSNGNGGQVALNSSSNLTLTDSVTVDGQGSGHGGTIQLIAGGVLAIGVNDLSAKGGSTGDGGIIRLTSGDDLTVDGGQVNVNPGTGSGSNGNGGTWTVVASGNVTVSGTFQANGVGEGIGGTVSVTAGGSIDLSEGVIYADGGESDGHGGSIHLTYNDSGALVVSILSVSTESEDGGGTIQIDNTANADLVVTASGIIRTTNSETLSGLLTLIPHDEGTNNALLTINSTGGLSAVLNTSVAGLEVVAEADIHLGVGNITANNGDVNICALAGGACAAVAALTSVSDSSNSTVELMNTIKLVSGKARLASKNILIHTDFNSAILATFGSTPGFFIECGNLTFESGAFIDCGSNRSQIRGGFDDISIVLGGTGGFINTAGVEMSNVGSGSIGISTSSGTAEFALPGQSSFSTYGDISLSSSVDIGDDAPSSNYRPNTISFSSTVGTITLTNIYAQQSIIANNSASNQPLVVGGLLHTIGSGSGIGIDLLAGGNLSQPSVTSISTTGVLELASTYGLIGLAMQPFEIEAAVVKITAPSASAYVHNNSTLLLTLKGSSAYNNLVVDSDGPIQVGAVHVTVSVGGLYLLARTGTVTIDPGATLTGGDVYLALQSLPTTLISGTPAANVTVLSGSGPGQIYWGTSPGITATAVTSVQANAHNIVFETYGAVNGIQLGGGGLTIVAN